MNSVSDAWIRKPLLEDYSDGSEYRISMLDAISEFSSILAGLTDSVKSIYSPQKKSTMQL